MRGEGRSISIASSAGRVAPTALLALLEANGDRLVGLTTRAGTLEDVFMALTGRALRDG